MWMRRNSKVCFSKAINCFTCFSSHTVLAFVNSELYRRKEEKSKSLRRTCMAKKNMGSVCLQFHLYRYLLLETTVSVRRQIVQQK